MMQASHVYVQHTHGILHCTCIHEHNTYIGLYIHVITFDDDNGPSIE